VKILKKIIGETKLEVLRPFGDETYYLKDILSSINTLKREGIDTANFREMAEDERKKYDEIEDLEHDKGPHKGKVKGKYLDLLKKINKHLDLVTVYEKYEEALTGSKLYDYDDMIIEVLRAFDRDDELLLSLQEKYQYVLVDEHQDTNRAQNRIVEKLMGFHDDPNIFVVGDDKQAIYRFQGASLENFYHFKELYPRAKLIALEENYRSTQSILDSAESLITGPKPLKANAGHEEKKMMSYVFTSEEVENYYLAKSISEKISSGVHPAEIAVLYRYNSDAFSIADILRKAGIPVSIESDENILGDEDVRKLFLIMKAADNFGDDAAFIEAAHVDFLGIDPFDIYRVIRFAEMKRVPPMRVFRSSETLVALELGTADKIVSFMKYLNRWSQAGKTVYLGKLFEEIIRDSGALSSIMGNPGAVSRLERVNGLFREVKIFAEKNRRAGLKELMEHLNMMEEEGVLIKKTNIAVSASSVRLMTAHRSKGQEFDHVYMVRAVDGKWGNKRRVEKLPLPTRAFSIEGRELAEEEELGDERRLFYVAITRARKSVSISYAKQNREGREQLPSQFLGEIRPELIVEGDVSGIEGNTEEMSLMSYSSGAVEGSHIGDPELIREVFAQKGLSPTDLNNYLACPWKYFYTSLFRIPEAHSKYQMYGTAVHGAMKDLFEAIREREVGKDFLISKFEYYLKKEPLKERDLEELLEKGRNALSGYHDRYSSEWRTDTLLEFSVRGIELAEGVNIKGRMDKIDILNVSNEVSVTDYKTGKPKTRGYIEGGTKDSKGDMKRQLTFYKLLLDNHKDHRYRMIAGDIDFIEPDEKGKYHKETFSITDQEVSDLKELILVVAREIMSLDFWDKRCDDPKCGYCAVRNMMD
jgi:DNA helicase-2/ATP-dependent DNA helicase PcrA